MAPPLTEVADIQLQLTTSSHFQAGIRALGLLRTLTVTLSIGLDLCVPVKYHDSAQSTAVDNQTLGAVF